MLEKSNLFRRMGSALEGVLVDDLGDLRAQLIRKLDQPEVGLADFAETVCAFWRSRLDVDRIFFCDMRDGTIVAGWQRGKNIVNLQDWDPDYRPLEDDACLQAALEGEELVHAPVEGQGADLAFSLPLDDGSVWLVAFDDTTCARRFSALDMAWIELARDLLVIKSHLLSISKV